MRTSYRAIAFRAALPAILLLTASCEKSPPPSAAAPAESWRVIVDADWLRGRMSGGGLVVVDTRDPAAYAAEHIPGAVNVPRAATYDRDPARKDDVAPIHDIEALFGRAGVVAAMPVVLYDDKNYRDAARVFWVLEVHGHPRVAVLNGGLSGWKARGFAVSDEPVTPAPGRFIANVQPDRMVSKLQVAQATRDPRTVIVDSRSREEYLGEKTETARAGHIPAAVSVDFNRNLTATGRAVCQILDFDELATIYQGVPASSRMITYCSTGTRASVSYLVLRALNRNVAVYDGSWQEWSNDPSLPIVTGEFPGASTRTSADDR